MEVPVCLRPGRVSVCFQDECGGPDVRPAVSEEYSLVIFAGGGRLPMHTPWL